MQLYPFKNVEDKLIDFISELKSKRLVSLDEATTKQIVILRLLSTLGWNTYDPNEVKPEYSVGGKRVDYCLRYNGQNKVFIEVKNVGEDLENHQKQLLEYSFGEGIELAILTNGISWWYYLPLQPGSWEQRKFFTIDITQQETKNIATNFVNFLSKENIASGKTIENAKEVYKSRQKQSIINSTIPKAWNKVISETDESLIDLINDVTEKICGFKASNEQVAKFINNHKSQIIILEEMPPTTVRKKEYKQVTSDISKYVTRGYAGKQIRGFSFNNNKHDVRSWRAMLLKLCKILHTLHPKDFEKVLSLKGRKRPYFTFNPNELREPGKIEGTEIFVETNMSANYTHKFCEDVLSLFGYTDSLKIHCD